MLNTDRLTISEYTENEFRNLLEEISHAQGGEKYQDALIVHFMSVCPHPEKSDLIFWPSDGDSSEEAIIKKIKQYCIENGLPCFQSE